MSIGANINNFSSIKQVVSALKTGQVTCEELVSSVKEQFEIDKKNLLPLNAFLEIYEDIIPMAQEVDKQISQAVKDNTIEELYKTKPLFGVPFANKDNISFKGHKLTCASKILQGYVAPYSATVIDRLQKAGAIPLGRCNQDEFAMGSSTEYSIYGPTRNPINREYVSGGSSGGSAASVAANLALFSLGTETGGSVRLPASYCGIYGLKPTYGVLSRWGVVAYGSSLDQVGIMGHSPADIALPLYAMSNVDFRDDTSCDLPYREELLLLKKYTAMQTLKIAVPKQFLQSKGLDCEVKEIFDSVIKWFVDYGAKVDTVDIPILDSAIASYYVIALAEAASNLSRFDGIRYGARVDMGDGYDELFIHTRSSGFGPEVKRRIIIGNYVLSEQFSGDTYKRGMTVRAKIQSQIAHLFDSYDLILCPTCPTPAFKLGAKVENPLEMYLSDLFTTFVNLARIPSISVPAGYTSGVKSNGIKLPVGIQFAGAMFSETKLLQLAQVYENDHAGCGIPLFCANGEK